MTFALIFIVQPLLCEFMQIYSTQF